MPGGFDRPVEFRWVDRSIVRNPKVMHYHGPDREKVLQVRYLETNQGVYFCDKNSRYTRWEDVPLVRLS